MSTENKELSKKELSKEVFYLIKDSSNPEILLSS